MLTGNRRRRGGADRSFRPHAERDELLRSMHAAGTSVRQMALRLGVSDRSVRWYLECLELRVPKRKRVRSALLELYNRAMAGDVHYLHKARERSRDELRAIVLGELRAEQAKLLATRRDASDVTFAISLWEADEAWRNAS